MLALPQARSPGAASRESMTETLPGAFSVLGGLGPSPQRPLLTAAAANAIGKQPGRREYLPAQVVAVDGRWQVKTTGNQGIGRAALDGAGEPLRRPAGRPCRGADR